MLLDRGSC